MCPFHCWLEKFVDEPDTISAVQTATIHSHVTIIPSVLGTVQFLLSHADVADVWDRTISGIS